MQIFSFLMFIAGIQNPAPGELPVHMIPNIGPAAEFYFSPNSKQIIGTAKRAGDEAYHEYILNIDGTHITRINGKGEDACSYWFPDGKRVIWTSTKDHPELPKGNYSNPGDYPQGAELYISDFKGGQVKRITFNNHYDAEVSVSPDGKKILFARDMNGKMDLWKMDADGTHERQITHMEGKQPGGCFYMSDSKTIIFRAWDKALEGKTKGGMPMTLYTIWDDGTHLRQLTHDGGTNWAPFPAPDGHHYVFVKVLPPHHFEIFLGDINSDEQKQLTFHPSFNGFPVISPDAHWLLFASSRDATKENPTLTLYLMDISSLNLGAPKS